MGVAGGTKNRAAAIRVDPIGGATLAAKLDDLELAHHVFPYPVLKLWESEAELANEKVILSIPTVPCFSRESLSQALLGMLLPASKEASFADGGWALEYLRFTGLSQEAVEVRADESIPGIPDRIQGWIPPDTHRPFCPPGFGGPVYSTLLYLRYFAKVANESPAARRKFKGCMEQRPSENRTILILSAMDEFVSLNIWLPISILQAMGYAVLKNHVLGPKYRVFAQRNLDLAPWYAGPWLAAERTRRAAQEKEELQVYFLDRLLQLRKEPFGCKDSLVEDADHIVGVYSSATPRADIVADAEATRESLLRDSGTLHNFLTQEVVMEQVDPRLEQASVARFFSHVFQVAVQEALELYADHPEDAAADGVLVNGAFRRHPQEAADWTRQFVQGLANALDAMRDWNMEDTDVEEVVRVYCERDPQHMERVAVGMAIQQALQHIQGSLNHAFPQIIAAGMLADWFRTEGQTDAGIAWLMDTTAHLIVADAMPAAS